jgi:hypothetical protein
MHEHVVELVVLGATLGPGREGCELRIGIKAGGLEASEELHHGEVELSMSVDCGGIDQPGLACFVCEAVP